MYQSKRNDIVNWNLTDPVVSGGPLDNAQVELFFRNRADWQPGAEIDVLSYRVARYHILHLLGRGFAAIKQRVDGSVEATKASIGFQNKIDWICNRNEVDKEEIIGLIVDAIYAKREIEFRFSDVPRAQRYFARAAASKVVTLVKRFEIELNSVTFDEDINPSRELTGRGRKSDEQTSRDIGTESDSVPEESESTDGPAPVSHLYQRQSSHAILYKQLEYIDEICMEDMADWHAERPPYQGKRRPPVKCLHLVLMLLVETKQYKLTEIAEAINDVHAGERLVGEPVDWDAVERSLLATRRWRDPRHALIAHNPIQLHPHHCWPDMRGRRIFLPEQWLPIRLGRDSIHSWFPLSKGPYSDERLRQIYNRRLKVMREEAEAIVRT